MVNLLFIGIVAAAVIGGVLVFTQVPQVHDLIAGAGQTPEEKLAEQKADLQWNTMCALYHIDDFKCNSLRQEQKSIQVAEQQLRAEQCSDSGSCLSGRLTGSSSSQVRLTSMTIDSKGSGAITMCNTGGSDTVKTVKVTGIGQATPNFVLKGGEKGIAIPFNLNANLVAGSQVTVVISMQSGAQITQTVTVSPAGSLNQALDQCNIIGSCYQNPISASSTLVTGNFKFTMQLVSTETFDLSKGNLIHVNLNAVNVGKVFDRFEASEMLLFDNQGRQFHTTFLATRPSSIALEPGFSGSIQTTYQVPSIDMPYSLEIGDKFLEVPVKQAIANEKAAAQKIADEEAAQQEAAREAEAEKAAYLEKLATPALGYIEIKSVTLNPGGGSTVTIHNQLPNTCGGANWCNVVVIDTIFVNGKQAKWSHYGYEGDFVILSGESSSGKGWSTTSQPFTQVSDSSGLIRVTGHLNDADKKYSSYHQQIFAEYTVS